MHCYNGGKVFGENRPAESMGAVSWSFFCSFALCYSIHGVND